MDRPLFALHRPLRDWMQTEPWRMIRVNGMRYIWYPGGARELYDLEADPFETTNLVAEIGPFGGICRDACAADGLDERGGPRPLPANRIGVIPSGHADAVGGGSGEQGRRSVSLRAAPGCAPIHRAHRYKACSRIAPVVMPKWSYKASALSEAP